ncbi:MAG: aminomethyl-transferring glycine dehydrogenase subunit GcvPB, partial [Kiritimatiellae bacterium]|nr:aminomethyl-transferring glycine dehydrogenase subunit GcvPB [Kiritimatiellia bacterium]
VSDHAGLNANYVLNALKDIFPAVSDRCMHECVLSAKPLVAGGPAVAGGVRAMDIAKGLIDRGFHPPTVYFPMIVPEAMMIEPTETETRETLDAFIQAMRELEQTARTNPAALHAAPITTTVGRLDEVAAARSMNLAFEAP